MRIGILGAGKVGSTLGTSWVKSGYEVVFGVRDAATDKDITRFNNPCEFALLHLETTFISRTLSEIVDVDDLEVVPQFKLYEPLIHQIGVVLKAELESDGLGSRL